MVLEVLQGLVIGALAAISVMFTFQTRMPYPSWVLQVYDKPWVMLVLAIICTIVMFQYREVGAMLLLLLAAVWMDGLLFARSFDQDPLPATPEAPFEKPTMEVYPYTEPSERRMMDTFGPSVEAVPLPEPLYPVFYDLGEMSPGPAPF